MFELMTYKEALQEMIKGKIIARYFWIASGELLIMKDNKIFLNEDKEEYFPTPGEKRAKDWYVVTYYTKLGESMGHKNSNGSN